eukprot:768745_1
MNKLTNTIAWIITRTCSNTMRMARQNAPRMAFNVRYFSSKKEVEFEDKFDVEIHDEEAEKIETIGDAVNLMILKQEESLFNDIHQMITGQTQSDNQMNDTTMEQIMHKIRKLDPKSTSSDRLRIAASHFIATYYTGQEGMGLATNVAKMDYRRDMELGWNLLNISYSSSIAARSALLGKIDVAQRLEDPFKLKNAFDDLMRFDLSDEEKLVAFTVPPYLGDWKTMMHLGKEVEKMTGAMERLHISALRLCVLPDIPTIYDLCKEYELDKNETTTIESLEWKQFNVKKVTVKFKDIDVGPFEEKRQELMAEINEQGDVEWDIYIESRNTGDVHIKRMGALCQAVGFNDVPMMLNGPWLSEKIHVRGRAEMPLMSPEMQQQAMQGQNPWMGGGQMPDPSQMTILIQEEEWKLDKDPNNENMYIGTYALRQRPQLPQNVKLSSEHAPVNMIFDCQVLVGEAGDEDTDEKNPNDANNGSSNDKAKEEEEKKGTKKSKGVVDDDSDECAQEDDEQQTQLPIVTEFDDLELD